MSHYNYIQGIRIPLPYAVSQDTAAGIYTSSGASEIRLVESPVVLTAAPTAWASGHILENGIGTRKQSLNLRRGGDVAKVSNWTIKIDATGKLYLVLKSQLVSLINCVIELWEFVGTDANAEASSRDLLATYVIDSLNWNETDLVINCIPPEYKRNVSLAQKVNIVDDPHAAASDIGKVKPITFGDIDKAKMIRTASEETVYDETSFTDAGADSSIVAFPVVAGVSTGDGQPTLSYSFQVKNGAGAVQLTSFDHLYATIVGGAGNGQTRRITAMDESINYGKIDFTVDKYFETPPSYKIDLSAAAAASQKIIYVYSIVGYAANDSVYLVNDDLSEAHTIAAVDATLKKITFNENITGINFTHEKHSYLISKSNVSWVKIRRIYQEYTLDTWPCKGMKDADGNIVSKGMQLYSYQARKKTRAQIAASIIDQAKADANLQADIPVEEEDSAFLPIPTSAYTGDATNGNKIDLNPKMIDGSPDRLLGFTALPVLNPALCTKTTLADWGFPTFLKNEAGAFAESGSWPPTCALIDGNINNVNDKDSTTYANYRLTADEHPNIFCIEFDKPVLPDGMKFDGVYLGLLIYCFPDSVATIRAELRMRKFYGDSETINDTKDFETTTTSGPVVNYTLDSVLDSYFTTDRATNDKNFYHPRIAYLTAEGKLFSGYSTFKLPVSNAEDYKMIDKLCFMLYYDNTNYESTAHDIRIHEISLIFKFSANVKTDINVPGIGRKINDTWGTRKTATDAILNPVDILEHFKRIANWSEVGDSVAFGKAYSPNAKIRTGAATVGSFDDSSLTTVKLYRPAFQLFSESDQKIDSLTRNLCESFFLLSYRDASGYECVKDLLNLETPTETVTLDDVKGDIEPVEDPEAMDIFCEPFVRYNYNYGSGKYDGFLAIGSIANGGTFDPDYCPGFSGTDAETVWYDCKWLYNRYKAIEKPPANMTDKIMIRTYADALAYLRRWVSYMKSPLKRRLAFSVPYLTGRLWYAGKTISVQFPYHTNNGVLKCIIEQFEPNKNQDTSHVWIVLLDDIPYPESTFTRYQESGETQTTKYQESTPGASTKLQEIGI